MDHEIEHDVDVERARLEQGQAVRLDELEMRELGSRCEQRRIEALDVPDLELDPPGAPRRSMASASATVAAIGFSTSACRPGGGRLLERLAVGHGRNRDRDRVAVARAARRASRTRGSRSARRPFARALGSDRRPRRA